MLKVFIMLLGMPFQFVTIVVHRLYSLLTPPAVPVPWQLVQQLLIKLESFHNEEGSLSVVDQFFKILCSIYMVSLGIVSHFQVLEGNKDQWQSPILF